MDDQITESFKGIQDAVRESARLWYEHQRTTLSDEQLYGFAIYTDPDGFSICDAAEIEQDTNSHEWSIGEWSYGAMGGKNMCPKQASIDSDISDDEIYALREKVEEAGLNYLEMLADCITRALMELNEAGVFGTGEEREKLLVFVSIMDSEGQEEIENRSARALNSGPLLEEFLGRI